MCKTPNTRAPLSLLLCAAFWLTLIGCGDVEPAEIDDDFVYPDDQSTKGKDTSHTTLDGGTTAAPMPCELTPWGNSCKEGGQIYDLSFHGIDLSTNQEGNITFTDIRCAGYKSVVFVAGDTWCSVCPMWYEEIGKNIDKLHEQNAAVIVSSTHQFGELSLTNQDAAIATASANPDYTTGSDPFVFPCRYTFTPFTLVVDLTTATILGKDTDTAVLEISDVLELVTQANM